MANNKSNYVDPGWPEVAEGEHAVTELVATVAGGLTPFGSVELPLPESELPYVHPYTKTNR